MSTTVFESSLFDLSPPPAVDPRTSAAAAPAEEPHTKAAARAKVAAAKPAVTAAPLCHHCWGRQVALVTAPSGEVYHYQEPYRDTPEREWDLTIAAAYKPGHLGRAPGVSGARQRGIQQTKNLDGNRARIEVGKRQPTLEIVAAALEARRRGCDQDRLLYARLRADALALGEKAPFCLRDQLAFAHNHVVYANTCIAELERWIAATVKF